jgi:ubiquitin C-terminal hydrolase
LRAFFKPEKREIKCEKCFCETALQTTDITKLPRALLFHLKRFIVDISPDYTSISYRKDQSSVAFEPHLELDEHSGALGEVVAVDEMVLPRNSRYGIRSVVNHIGSSASCGHYTADAWRTCQSQEEKEDNNDDDDDDDDKPNGREWLRFNDSYVSKISQTEAVDNAASTAYMVLYELEPME